MHDIGSYEYDRLVFMINEPTTHRHWGSLLFAESLNADQASLFRLQTREDLRVELAFLIRFPTCHGKWERWYALGERTLLLVPLYLRKILRPNNSNIDSE